MISYVIYITNHHIPSNGQAKKDTDSNNKYINIKSIYQGQDFTYMTQIFYLTILVTSVLVKH